MEPPCKTLCVSETFCHVLSFILCALFFPPYSTVCLILLFSQYLSKVDVPMITYQDKKWKVFQYPLFKLFSVSGRSTSNNTSILRS